MFNLNDITNVAGYNALPLKKQLLFKNFLANFLRAWGLEARETIQPLSVKYFSNQEGKFLKFHYKFYGKKTWLHVLSPNIWY